MSTIQLQTLVIALAATVSFGQNTLCGRPFDFSLPAGTDRTNAVSVALLSELAYHYSAWTNYTVIFETETQGHPHENDMALDFIDSFERIFPRGFTVETNGTMTIAVDGNFYTRFESAWLSFHLVSGREMTTCRMECRQCSFLSVRKTSEQADLP